MATSDANEKLMKLSRMVLDRSLQLDGITRSINPSDEDLERALNEYLESDPEVDPDTFIVVGTEMIKWGDIAKDIKNKKRRKLIRKVFSIFLGVSDGSSY